jgi:hypothetical protein
MIKVILDKDFKGPVLSKRKVAFSLLEDNGLRRGDNFIMLFKGVGGRFNCQVDSVNTCRLSDVDFFMARAEGYVHQDLFVHELKSCFDSIRDDSVVFQYTFKII